MKTVYYWLDGCWCDEWELKHVGEFKGEPLGLIHVFEMETDAGVDAQVRCAVEGWL